MPKKLSVDNEMKELISDDDIHACFLQREDISVLSPDEQEEKWQEQLVAVNRLREWLTQFDSYVV